MSNIYEALQQVEREKNEGKETELVSVTEEGPAQQLSVLRDRDVRAVRATEKAVIVDLCRTIEAQLPEQNKKTVQFISAQRGEGVSTIVQEVARAAVECLGKRVLIVNATGRGGEDSLPAMKWMSGGPFPDKGGMRGPGCHQTGTANLCVASLPVGTSARSSFEELTAGLSVLNDLGQHFDLILIDSPPLEAEPTGINLVRYSDGVIMVLEADRTTWSAAENAKQRIVKNGGNILGVVFNKRRSHIPRFINKWFH